MKKLRLLFSALALLCLVSASAHDFGVGGIYYNITSSTNLTVEVTFRGTTSLGEYTGSVTIPESVTYGGKTYKVTSIGAGAFFSSNGLKYVTIGNSVTSIGERAFQECSSLTSVTIPNSVTSIGNRAFSSCYSLTSVVIGNSVTSIGDYAFYWCYGLTSVVIPNSVTSIGRSAFQECEGLTSVTIGNSVESIGNSAFEYCSGLTSVIIGNSVTSIGDNAFYDCWRLTEVELNCKSIGKWFQGNKYIKTLKIGNSVESIGDNAFSGCDGLTSVTIGNSVTSIGQSAFEGCWSLTSVTIPNSVTSIGERAFDDTLWYIFLPAGVVYINNVLYKYRGEMPSGTSIEIQEGTISISPSAFYSCYGLTSVTIPNSVTSIGFSAFADCSDITDVYCFAEEVPSTDGDAFKNSYVKWATLHVPAVSIKDYKRTEPWASFGAIVALTEEETGMEEIEAEDANSNDAPVYNLQGMKMQNTDNLPKGIYIKGGKKFMVK